MATQSLPSNPVVRLGKHSLITILSSQCGRGDLAKASGSRGGGRSAGGGSAAAAVDEQQPTKLLSDVTRTDSPDGVTTYSFTAGLGEAPVTLTIDPKQAYGGSNADVQFTVGGKTTKGRLPEGEVANAVALKLRSIIRNDAKTRPNGFKYSAWAETADGAGAMRTRAYRALGFSKPAYEGGAQYGVVRNGKIRPGRES